MATPEQTHLVLLGGGHCHANLLKAFAKNRAENIRITLVSESNCTPYSGLVPSYISGAIPSDACTIDLLQLCNHTPARLIASRAESVDFQEQRILFADRAPLHYDLLSINTGSVAQMQEAWLQLDYVYPLRPLNAFLARLEDLLSSAREYKKQYMVSMVGSGAAAIEMICALRVRIIDELSRINKVNIGMNFQLITDNEEILQGYGADIQERVGKLLRQQNIDVHRNSKVVDIVDHQIIVENGNRYSSDSVILATQATASPQMQNLDIQKNDEGFISVLPTLQTLNYTNVFAVGDAADFTNAPLPKAGVYPVRQSPVLYENILRLIRGKKLVEYKPQKTFFSALNLYCDTIARYKNMTLQGAAATRVKRKIDGDYMQKFAGLMPHMPDPSTFVPRLPLPDGGSVLPCGGCAAKVAPDTLRAVLETLPSKRSSPSQGSSSKKSAPKQSKPIYDDAHVFKPQRGITYVQSVDHLLSLFDNPFHFGQIATMHCLNDIYAMGGSPRHVLALVSMPYATIGGANKQQKEDLEQLLSGCISVLEAEEAELAGGHTSEGMQLSFGLSVTGVVKDDEIWHASIPAELEEQALILTKPLGTGVLLAANMRNLCTGGHFQQMLDSALLLSNRAAVACLREHGATACSDITGFGLIGHLRAMLEHSKGISCMLFLDQLPVLEGVQTYLSAGVRSSADQKNRTLEPLVQSKNDGYEDHALYPLLFDPQTSGGLLASVPYDSAEQCVKVLQEAGYAQASIIGQVKNSEHKNTFPIQLY